MTQKYFSQQGLAPIIIVLIAIAVLLVGGGAYFYLTKDTSEKADETSPEAISPLPSGEPVVSSSPSPSVSTNTGTPSATPSSSASPSSSPSPSATSSPSATASQTSQNEWNKCKNNELLSINWNVKINSISAFGGLYAKGYLLNDAAYPIHITWDTEKTDAATVRAKISDGDTINLRGSCQGVTTEGEVWVEATE